MTTITVKDAIGSSVAVQVPLAPGQATAGASRPVVIASDQTTIPAAQDTSFIANGTVALTPKFAKISTSSSGATTIVAAVTGKKIRVLKWSVKVAGAVNLKWQSHATPTDLTGLYPNATLGDGIAEGFCPVGHFETLAGEALDINLSGAVAVGGVLTYIEV